jgi:hypothetical protein
VRFRYRGVLERSSKSDIILIIFLGNSRLVLFVLSSISFFFSLSNSLTILSYTVYFSAIRYLFIYSAYSRVYIYYIAYASAALIALIALITLRYTFFYVSYKRLAVSRLVFNLLPILYNFSFLSLYLNAGSDIPINNSYSINKFFLIEINIF